MRVLWNGDNASPERRQEGMWYALCHNYKVIVELLFNIVENDNFLNVRTPLCIVFDIFRCAFVFRVHSLNFVLDILLLFLPIYLKWTLKNFNVTSPSPHIKYIISRTIENRYILKMIYILFSKFTFNTFNLAYVSYTFNFDIANRNLNLTNMVAWLKIMSLVVDDG